MPYIGAQPDKGNFADLNGAKLVIDADADTSLTADTDDQIDIEVAGADVLQIKSSSGDAVIKAAVDAKDILFQQYDGRTLLDVNDGGYVAIANGATGAGQLRLYEDTDNGTNYSAFQVGTQSGDVTYTLPTADGSSGQMLSTNGSGTLSWATAASADPSSADGDSLGSASAEWSDLYLADGGVIYFGNDQDVTVTHDPDDGLFLKSVATGDDNPFLLTLQTGETDIAADDIIGKIAFQAPDEGTGTDAVLVSAAIQARSEGDFANDSNATSIDFMVGASEAAATKMTLNSTGNLSISDGTVALPSLTNIGDLNTGVYFPAADQVGITTGGTEKVRYGTGNTNEYANRNLVLNGAFRVQQYEGVSTGLGGANYTYFIDGWGTYGTQASGRYTATQTTSDVGTGAGPTGSGHTLKVDITTADTDTSTASRVTAILQKFEGQFLQHLFPGGVSGAVPLTLSFWIKSPKSGQHTWALWMNDGNRSCPETFTVASADTWEKHSVTFPGDTGATFPPNDESQYMWLVFPLLANSGYQGTNNTWASGENYAVSGNVNICDNTSNNLYITDVQLEVGEIATDFEQEPVDTTIKRCQRYFQRIEGPSTVPWTTVVDSGTAGYQFWRLEHPMRANPTMTVSFAGSDGVVIANTNCLDDIGSVYVYTNQTGYASITLQSSPTAGHAGRCTLGANSYYRWESEM